MPALANNTSLLSVVDEKDLKFEVKSTDVRFIFFPKFLPTYVSYNCFYS